MDLVELSGSMASLYPSRRWRRRSALPVTLVVAAGIFIGAPALRADSPAPATTTRDALPAPHLSYGRLPTYSGTVVDFKTPEEKTIFFDAAEYDGHYDHVVRGLGRRVSTADFLRQVSAPNSRRYFPFLLYRLPAPIVIAGQEISFVVRPQRYRFDDSHEELAEVLAYVLQQISTTTGGSLGVGAAMLYDNTKRRPNAETADALARRHVVGIGLRALLDKVGATRVEVLHPGVAIGRLVRVAADEDPSDFGPDVIAVYDAVPPAAPTFAGVITLEPQTPLSHLNLLAKNRGTVNLSATSVDDIAGLEDHIGHAVRLVATQDRGRGGQVTVRRVTAKELAAATRKARAKLAIPRANTSRVEILSLGVGNRPKANALLKTVGAKADGYDRLFRLLGAEFVRPASALSFGAYQRHLASSGAQREIHRLVKDRRRLRRDQVRERLDKIAHAITSTPIDPRTIARVQRHLAATYGTQKVRLRSSTNCEDLDAFNGAGLYLSKGLKQDGKAPEDIARALDEKLRGVFASLWTERAFWEREFAGIDQRAPAMAILMHPAFEDEFGDGVALTLRPVVTPSKKSPARGASLKIAIQAQRGGAGVTHPEAGKVAESFTYSVGGPIPGVVTATGSEGAVLLDPSPSTRAALTTFLRHMEQVHAEFLPPTASASTSARKGRKRVGPRRVLGVDVEFKVLHEGDTVRVMLKQARLLSTPLPPQQ